MSTDLDLDLDDLDLDTDERTVTIRVDQLRQLREKAKQARKVGDLERELGALRREKEVRSTPGLSGLTDKQLAATLAVAGADATPEEIAAAAADLGFVKADDGSEDNTDLDATERVNRASEGAAPPKSGELSPADLEEWDQARLMRLNDAHPGAFELLMRGESVPRPAGF